MYELVLYLVISFIEYFLDLLWNDLIILGKYADLAHSGIL